MLTGWSSKVVLRSRILVIIILFFEWNYAPWWPKSLSIGCLHKIVSWWIPGWTSWWASWRSQWRCHSGLNCAIDVIPWWTQTLWWLYILEAFNSGDYSLHILNFALVIFVQIYFYLYCDWSLLMVLIQLGLSLLSTTLVVMPMAFYYWGLICSSVFMSFAKIHTFLCSVVCEFCSPFNLLRFVSALCVASGWEAISLLLISHFPFLFINFIILLLIGIWWGQIFKLIKTWPSRYWGSFSFDV